MGHQFVMQSSWCVYKVVTTVSTLNLGLSQPKELPKVAQLINIQDKICLLPFLNSKLSLLEHAAPYRGLFLIVLKVRTPDTKEEGF